MELPNRPLAFDAEHFVDTSLRRICGVLERLMVGRHFWQLRTGKVVGDRVRRDEIAVGEPLHQRTCAEAVRAVIGEIRFAQHEKPRDRALEVVVHPESAHRVVDGRVDAHRNLVGIFSGNPLVHLEQVAVSRFDDLDTQALDGLLEIEIDGEARFADTVALI